MVVTEGAELDNMLPRKRAKQQEPEAPHKKTKLDTALDTAPAPLTFDLFGVRHITPYEHKFSTRAKRAWIGRTVLDVLENEFPSHSRDHFLHEISMGRVTVNGRVVPAHFLLTAQSTLEQRVHRHEPPTSVEPIKVFRDDDTMVVVSKPSGMTLHPSGPYFTGTLTETLRRERGDVFVVSTFRTTSPYSPNNPGYRYIGWTG